MRTGRKIWSIVLVVALLMGLAVPAAHAEATKTIQSVAIEDVGMIPIVQTTTGTDGFMTYEMFDITNEAKVDPKVTVTYTDGTTLEDTMSQVEAQLGGVFSHVNVVDTTSAWVPGDVNNWDMVFTAADGSTYNATCKITVRIPVALSVADVTVTEGIDRRELTDDNGNHIAYVYDFGGVKDPEVMLTFQDGSTYKSYWNALQQETLWHMGYKDDIAGSATWTAGNTYPWNVWVCGYDSGNIVELASDSVNVTVNANSAVTIPSADTPLTSLVVAGGAEYTYSFTPGDNATYLVEFAVTGGEVGSLENLQLNTSYGGGEWFVRNDVWYRLFTATAGDPVTVTLSSVNSIEGELGVYNLAAINDITLEGTVGGGSEWNDFVGQYHGLQVTPVTAHAANITYTWTSSDESVVAIVKNDGNGNETLEKTCTETAVSHGYQSIKAIGNGTATITVTATDDRGGTATATFDVEVYGIAGNLDIGKNTLTVPANTKQGYLFVPQTTGGYMVYGPKGDVSFYLDAGIPNMDRDSADGTQHYSGSNDMTAEREYILEVSNNSNTQQTLEVFVNAMSLSLDETSLNLALEETATLNASCNLSDIDISDGWWEVVGSGVEIVSSNGTTAEIKAVADGTAMVKFHYTAVRNQYGGFAVECEVVSGTGISSGDGDDNNDNEEPTQPDALYVSSDPTRVDLDGSAVKEYVFTPDVGGKYCFVWAEEQGDLHVDISLEENDVEEQRDTRVHEGTSFCRVYALLDAGKTYTVVIGNNNLEPAGADLMLQPMEGPSDLIICGQEGYMAPGETRDLWLEGYSLYADMEGITWKSSDEAVITVAGEGVSCVVTAVAGGEAQVQLLAADGTTVLTDRTITVYDPATNAVWSEEFTVTGDTEHVLALTFDKPSGYYFLKWKMGTPIDRYDMREIPEGTEQLFDYDQNGYEGRVYYLEKGMNYELVAYVRENCSYTVYLEPVTIATGATLSETEADGTVGTELRLDVALIGGIMGIHAESSNENVAKMSGQGNGYVNIMPIAAGEAVITVYDYEHKALASCKITVAQQTNPIELRVGEEKSLAAGSNGVLYSFTPTEDAVYFIGHNQHCDHTVHFAVTDGDGETVSGTDYHRYDRIGAFFDLKKGVTYTITATSQKGVSCNVMVEPLPVATDVILNASEVSGTEGDILLIPFALDPEGSLPNFTITSDDPTVAKVLTVSNEGIQVALMGGGETEIQVKVNDTTTYSCKVTSTALPAEQKLQLDVEKTISLPAEEEVAYYFTPTESGLYFVYREAERAEGVEWEIVPYEICVGDTRYGNEYGFDNGEQVGHVFAMTAGITYRLPMSSNIATEVGVGVRKVVAPTSITFREDNNTQYDTSMGGMTLYFDLGPEDAVANILEPVSSNPAVAVSDGRSGRSINLCILGAGETTITVMTDNGLSDEITITVEEAPEAPEAKPIELDAYTAVEFDGVNIEYTYQFTPEETGYYNIRTFCESVMDVAVMGFWGESCDPGVWHDFVLELNAGETYDIKVFLMDGISAQLGVTTPVLPTSITLTGIPTQREFVEGYSDQGLSPESLEGLAFEITWADGEVTTHTLEQMMESSTVRGFDLIARTEEKDDGTGSVILACADAEASYAITLIENPVASVELLNPMGLKIPERTYGLEEDGTWYYSKQLLKEALQLKINYTDGTSETISMNQEYYKGYQVLQAFEEFQWDNPWTVGNNTTGAAYLGKEAYLDIEVVENTVAAIEVISAPTTKFVFGNEEYGIVENDGSYTFIPGNYDQYKGLSFKITYTDGTSETVTADQLTWPNGTDYDWASFGFYKGLPVETYVEAVDGYGDYYTGDWFEEPGELVMTIRYAGQTDEYTLTLHAAHTHSLTHVPEVEPTCTEEGTCEYWSCGCGMTFGDAEGKNEISISHSAPNGHTTVKVEAVAPTCTEEGNKECWICEDCDGIFADEAGKKEVAEEDVLLPASGHSTEKVAAQAPSCTEDGNVEHWVCSTCEATFSDEEGKSAVEDVTAKAGGHKLEKTVGKAATCTEDGCITYWTCSVCKSKFSDEAGKTEITKVTITKNGHALAKVEGKDNTCTEDGVLEHWVCTACDKKFSDAAGTKEITTEVVLRATGHKLTKVEAVAVTCTKDGNVEHWKCDTCAALFSDAAGKTALKDAAVKAAGHKLTAVTAKEATYTAPGNIAYWTCSGCDVLFGDAEGKTEVADVVIPQLIKVEEEKATVSENAVDNAIEEALKSTTEEPTTPGEPEKPGEDKEEAEVVEVVLSVKDNTSESTAVSTVELPVASVEKLVEANEQVKDEVVLTVEMHTATVTLDSKALEAVADQAKGQEVSLVIEEVKPEELNKVQQNVIKNRKVEMVISAELVSGDKNIHDFKGGNITVKLPFTPKEGRKGNEYTILYVADSGKVEKIKTHYENGHLVFTLKHFSEYVVALDVEEDNPGTGDAMQLGLMTVLAISSAAVLAGESLFGRKKRR